MGIASGFETLFSQVYSEVLAFLFWPAVIAMAAAAATWIFSSNPQTVEKGKSWCLRILLALILAYGAKFIVQAVVDVAKNL